MDASNYFSGAVESSSSSANDLDSSKPRHHMRPIGPLRRTDHYVALLSAYVADAASLRSPPATAVESSSAASSPEDDSSPVPEDLTYDGSYLLRFMGIESLTDSSSEGQVTDNAETNQKPISHHKDSDGHQKQFVSEDGSEIHNVNIQLQDDSFKNPNDSSNHGEVAPIHHNSWSTEDWNIHTIFNNKYMDMPPQAAFAVGPRLLPPPFYSDADQYLLPISLGIQSPSSSSEGQVANNAETNIGTSANQKPMSHKDSDGHREQLVADDHDTRESRVESGSEINNVNVQLQNDSFKNPNNDSSNHQSEVALAPIHCNSWSTEDWNIHTIFNNKYMDMPPQAAFAAGPRLLPPPPFYSDDADQYLLPSSLSPT